MEDRWLVPLGGLAVTQCRVDHAFTLVVTDEPKQVFEVRIEQPFFIESRGVESAIDLEAESACLGPALSVLHQVVERASAFKDGRLGLAFANGTLLRVPFSVEFEAWEIVGPDGLRIVSLPGGELALWRPSG